MSELLRPGMFLLADPSLSDPNFEGAVVLLVAHSAEGSLGLIVNRPTELKLGDVLADPGPFQDRDAPMFWGGPVALDHMHMLYGGASSGKDAVTVCDGVHFGGELAEAARATEAGAPARFFLGYSGWGEGQLEEEMASHTWRVAPARAEQVFDERPEALWPRMLAQLDQRWSWMRNLPGDPSVN